MSTGAAGRNRPTRTTKPGPVLADPNNTAQPEIPSHRAIIANDIPRTQPTESATPQSNPSLETPTPSQPPSSSSDGTSSPAPSGTNKRTSALTEADGDNQQRQSKHSHHSVQINGKYSVGPRNRLQLFCIDEIDSERMHVDVHVIEIDSGNEDEKKNSDPTADIKEFFVDVPPRSPSDKKRRVQCVSCRYVLFSSFFFDILC
jgi:hypothetical protein